MNPAAATAVPPAVFLLWKVGLALTLLVFVPLALHLLHRTWKAARLIQRYAADTLAAAAGIAGNTAQIPALDGTIVVAGDMLAAAGGVASKLDTAATALAARAAAG